MPSQLHLRPLLALICLVLMAPSARAQTPVAASISIGPPGGASDAVAASHDGQVLYLATPKAGMFRSPDAGLTWRRLAQRPSGQLHQLAVDGGDAETLYAATSSGLFQSRDGGGTWQALNGRIPGVNGCEPATQACGRAVAVIEDPLRSGGVLAAFADADLVVRSDDRGLTWRRATSGLQSLFVSLLIPVPARPGTFYAATNHGVRVSRDGGATWSPSGLKPYFTNDVAVDAGPEGGAYAITQYYHHYAGILHIPWIRGRGTENFSPAASQPNPLPFYSYDFTTDPFVSGIAFGASPDGVFRSLDRGNLWKRVDLRPVRAVLPIYGTPGAFLAQAGPDEGSTLLSTSDGGESWKPAALGVGAQAARQIRFDPERPLTLYAMTAKATLRRTSDGGATWRRIFAPDRYDQAADFVLDPFDPARLLLANDEGLFHSSDRGSSWTLALEKTCTALAADPSARGTFYAATFFEGLVRSTDGGASWQQLPALQRISVSRLLAVPRPGASSLLYAAGFDRYADPTRRHRIYRSEDGGRTWSIVLTLRKSDAPFTTLIAVPGHPERLFAGFNNLIGYPGTPFDGGLYRTTDSGAHWQLFRLSAERPPVLSLLLDPRNPDHLFAGTTLGRVFESRDAGATWSELAAGLPPADVRDLRFDPTETAEARSLFAALEGASVYRIALGR